MTTNPSMAEEEEIPRSRGTVKWFRDNKGYGFITPDDGGEDLFVHHSSIKSDGFRTLREGQLVEFHIALEDERTKAIHVTSLDKTPKSNGRIGSGDRYRNNGGANAYGGSGGGCYTCGESGHISRDCRHVATGGGGDGRCYSCGDFGHMARDCNRGARGGFNGGGGGCYECGDFGHMARDCNRGARGGGFNNGGGACYNCGGQGHVVRQCPSERRFYTGGGGSGGGGRECFNCGEEGHFARECPNATAKE